MKNLTKNLRKARSISSLKSSSGALQGTHPPIFILFGYKNGIGDPIWVVHFLNETSV
jgi:hypothetical protein